MKKRIVCLALLLMMIVGMVSTAHAEEYTGENCWQVEFTNDKKMLTTFESAKFADIMYWMQPGDQATIRLTLKNTSSITTDWYMTNKAIKTLEDTQSVAAGGGYTYILTYYNPAGGEEILYSSESVGGEKISVVGEGLHEISSSLKEFFYLDTLAPGAEAEITLYIALDGESQGNVYQDTLAEIQMNFAVETPNGTSINTGDESAVVLWAGMAMISGFLLIGLAALSYKKGQKGA